MYRKEKPLKKFLILAIVTGFALAGPRFGGSVGYYSGEDPRTGSSVGSPVFGGQFVVPLLNIINLELSAGYTSSSSDIIMSDYLFSYIEEEGGPDLGGNVDSLLGYLEEEWGWEDPTVQELTSSYTATYHDLDVGLTLTVNLPIENIPVKPYIGGGGGAHFQVSDADLLIAYINEQTGNPGQIDPYDHVHPGVHGVVGLTFSPPIMPVSFFGEYRIAKPIGDEAGSAISMYKFGVNLGF
jgi:hypothetical protein